MNGVFRATLAGVISLALLSGAARNTESPKNSETGSRDVEIAQPSIIPKPASLERLPGDFVLKSTTGISYQAASSKAKEVAAELAAFLNRATGYSLTAAPTGSAEPHPDSVLLTTRGADPALGNEGYTLEVNRQGVAIRALTGTGLFYGVQTLRQLLPKQIESRRRVDPPPAWTVPCVRIADKPRFAWRGLMLDSSRHFQDKAFILHLLDVMAYFKLNRFHWHLVDANGWRLQISRYPRLTQVAAWRNEDGQRYGGYYTKADVREILAHAKQLHILVVPEIEMPAHEAAALYAYPELTCSGKPFPIGKGGLYQYSAKVGNIPFCAGRDETFTFLDNVLDEVCDLFDSPYIHVGGDERPKGVWDKCPLCRARMKKEGLKDEHDLQNWFMRKISDYLAKKGRRVISWAVTRSDPYNPTDMDDLGNNAIIQNWHGGTRFAARQGWDVINSANGSLYFDYPEFPGMDKPKWMPILTLDKVYKFDPVPANLEARYRKHIWGGEACLWTELVPQDKVYSALFPRLLALAEDDWTPADRKDFPQFKGRVDRMEGRLALMGVTYGKPPVAAPPHP